MEGQGKHPRSGDWHISGWPAILLAPFLVPLALIAGFFSKPKVRTPAEVAGFIRDFLDGTGGDWDWDDFTSVPIADAELESLRREADKIALPLTEQGREYLRALLVRAEKLKSEWIDAGQPE